MNTKLDAIEGKTSEDSKDQLLINHGYANLIGSLMYLAITTQPDIACSVNKFAQYTSAPKEKSIGQPSREYSDTSKEQHNTSSLMEAHQNYYTMTSTFTVMLIGHQILIRSQSVVM